MKSSKSLQSIGLIHIGQILRITKREHISGLPVLDSTSWVSNVTEGVLNRIRRVDGGVMLKIGSSEFFMGVSPLGPLMNHGFGHFEIIASQPEQMTLGSMKGGAK